MRMGGRKEMMRDLGSALKPGEPYLPIHRTKAGTFPCVP